MPTHALLGATGSTGAAVLRAILSSRQQKSRESQEKATKEPLALNIFVRNEAKLHSLFPDLPVFSTTTTTTTTSPISSSLPSTHTANLQIHLFIGPISDPLLLKSCLRNAEVTYNCIGTNSLRKNENLEVSTAHKIITALKTLQQEQQQQLQEKRTVPTLLWNRTIGLNPQIRNPVPEFIEGILEWAVGWALEDMRSAQEIYASAVSNDGILRLVCIDAPKLFDTSGVQRTGYELVRQGSVRTGLYYGDLGDAMVEVARKETREGVLRDGAVGAVGVGAKRQVEVNLFVVMGSVLALLGRGVLVRCFGVYI